jgi:hypothetical protein
MNCFNHPKTQSVLLCKNCLKGLCVECCQQKGQAFACSPSCAKAIEISDELVEFSYKYMQSQGKFSPVSLMGFFFFITGILCIGNYLWNCLKHNNFNFFLVGIILMMVGATYIVKFKNQKSSTKK